jgi:hypothetical protein
MMDHAYFTSIFHPPHSLGYYAGDGEENKNKTKEN